MMSIPSDVTWRELAPVRGCASAKIIPTSARLRRTKSARVMARPARGPRSSVGTRE
jgi:hypothetical protein